MPHLLIVDDEPAVSWALSEGLRDDGFTTEWFRNAEDARVRLERGDVDLVIADLRLPGMSGVDFARQLKEHGPSLPVILVTAESNPGTAESLARVGIVDCFPKPFQIEPLRQAVHRALQPAATSRARRTS